MFVLIFACTEFGYHEIAVVQIPSQQYRPRDAENALQYSDKKYILHQFPYNTESSLYRKLILTTVLLFTTAENGVTRFKYYFETEQQKRKNNKRRILCINELVWIKKKKLIKNNETRDIVYHD